VAVGDVFSVQRMCEVEGRVQVLFSTGRVEALFAGQWEWVIYGALRHPCSRSISKTRYIHP
jgi:hypothetical protein